MKLFVGLGNPGPRYAETRHNVGWMAVDAIARAHGFGPERRRFQGQLAEGRLGSEKVLILKPETFMNLSGQAVGEALRFHKLTPADVVVFHDELDLAPGKCRVKQGGGHAGHNGLRSLHQHIGPDYARVRIGIGHPGDKNRVADYVLHPFPKADHHWIDPLLDGIADGAPKLAQGDAAGFQNAVALRMQPARPDRPASPKGQDQGDEAPRSADPGRGAAGNAADGPFAALKRLIGG
ncbi:MAG: aminoacyl-tRNA hydrolase [Rubrimonas sp.]